MLSVDGALRIPCVQVAVTVVVAPIGIAIVTAGGEGSIVGRQLALLLDPLLHLLDLLQQKQIETVCVT